MKTKLLIVALTTIFVTACSKDKFGTKPQLTFKGVNTDVLYPNAVIEFTLHYTDKDGDIQNTQFYIEKITKNCTLSNFVDSSHYTPMDVPPKKDAEGDIIIRYLYGIADGYATITGPVCDENDTCVFRFALKDQANNSSDTVTSSQIVIIKN